VGLDAVGDRFDDTRSLPLAGGSLGLAFAQVEIVARDTASESGMIGAAG